MGVTYITKSEKLVEQLSRFTFFVHNMDGYSGYISFRDSTGFLGRRNDVSTGPQTPLKMLKLRNLLKHICKMFFLNQEVVENRFQVFSLEMQKL